MNWRGVEKKSPTTEQSRPKGKQKQASTGRIPQVHETVRAGTAQKLRLASLVKSNLNSNFHSPEARERHSASGLSKRLEIIIALTCFALFWKARFGSTCSLNLGSAVAVGVASSASLLLSTQRWMRARFKCCNSMVPSWTEFCARNTRALASKAQCKETLDSWGFR